MNDHSAVAELVRKAEQDTSLQEALQGANTPEDVVQVAAKAGVTVSVGEVEAFQRDLAAFQQKSTDGELSEADLEAVAGGIFGSIGITLGSMGGLLFQAGLDFGQGAVRGFDQFSR